MKKVIVVHKNVGETPLEALERTRLQEIIDSKIPMTYAGRLDPMAEGVLVVLTGDECKNKEKYLGLDKEYEIEVLFGVETDTGDVLGLIKKVDASEARKISVDKYLGKFIQKYPRYSSKIIAMKEKPDEMPTKEVEIYSIEKIGEREVSGEEIAITTLEKISKVKGDFRQEEIAEDWQAFGQEFSAIDFTVISLRVRCSSGTYMRSLAERIGKEAGVGAIACSIKRLSVGKFRA